MFTFCFVMAKFQSAMEVSHLPEILVEYLCPTFPLNGLIRLMLARHKSL